METNCELIVAVVNRGYAETAMNAARTAGATGGTVTHGRGTGGKEVKKILGVTIQPEKEMILILVATQIRSKVMRAIAEAVGLNTDGQGICFSLPVEAVAGITLSRFAKEPDAILPAEANAISTESEHMCPAEHSDAKKQKDLPEFAFESDLAEINGSPAQP